MAAGFSLDEVLGFDLLTFGAALRCLNRHTDRAAMEATFNARAAYHADDANWKKWIKRWKKLMPSTAGSVRQFVSDFTSGKIR